MLLCDGYEAAFIGVMFRFGISEPVAAYDRKKCIEIILRDGCTWAEAEEFFEFNILGAWMGELTPVFIEVEPLSDALDGIITSEDLA